VMWLDQPLSDVAQVAGLFNGYDGFMSTFARRA